MNTYTHAHLGMHTGPHTRTYVHTGHSHAQYTCGHAHTCTRLRTGTHMPHTYLLFLIPNQAWHVATLFPPEIALTPDLLAGPGGPDGSVPLVQKGPAVIAQWASDMSGPFSKHYVYLTFFPMEF